MENVMIFNSVAQAVTASKAAARAAEQEFMGKYGEPAYCGFAWVEVMVTRTNSKEAKALLAAGFSTSYKPRTLQLWNPGGSPTQSMDVKEAGAVACAEVLRQAGIQARACSRAD